VEARQVVHGRLPGPERGDDSVESRERPPIGMMAPGTGATNELQILSVQFVSDHGVLLDHDVDWEDGGFRSANPSGRGRRAIQSGIRLVTLWTNISSSM
jgi:hypothetical protein